MPAFITSEQWLAASPDLSPLDFSVWSVFEAKVSAHPHPNVASLKKALLKAWDELDIDYLRTTTAAFTESFHQVICEKGGRMENCVHHFVHMPIENNIC